jgi:hypothetical protein
MTYSLMGGMLLEENFGFYYDVWFAYGDGTANGGEGSN